MTTPTGVEDGLILGAGRTQLAVDVQRAVGNALACVAPQSLGTLLPLAIAGELCQAAEGQHITQCVLIQCLVGGGNGGRAEGVVLQCRDHAIFGIVDGEVHHPGAQIPADLLSGGDVALLAGGIVQAQANTQQRRCGFLVDGVGVQSACGGEALLLQLLVVVPEGTHGAVEVLVVVGMLPCLDQRQAHEAAQGTLGLEDLAVAIPQNSIGAVGILQTQGKVTGGNGSLVVLGLVDAGLLQHFVGFKVAVGSGAVVAGIVVEDLGAVGIALDILGSTQDDGVDDALVVIIAKLPAIHILHLHILKADILALGVVQAVANDAGLGRAKLQPLVVHLQCHFQVELFAVADVAVNEGVGHGGTLTHPAVLVVMLLLFVGGEAGVPLGAGGDAAEAVALLLVEVTGEGDGQVQQLLCLTGGIDLVTVEAPGKVHEALVAELGTVGTGQLQNGLKLALGLHGALEGRTPEVALQGAGLFLLGEDDHMLATLFHLVQRASVVVVGLGHQRNADVFVLGVGAGRNGHTVGCPGPGGTVLVTVADVLGVVAPAVAVVADSRHHGEGGLAEQHQLHAHMVYGCFGLAHPAPCAVFNGGKGVGSALTGDDAAVSLAVAAQLVGAVSQNNVCHKITSVLQ